MRNWKSVLKADPTDWLLESENPSVRYFALRDIMGEPEDTVAMRAARREIMRTGMVPGILQKQREPAYGETYRDFYTSKYEGLVWQLIVLAELGAEADQQIMEQCEYILRNSQETEGGGFAMHTAAKQGGGRHTCHMGVVKALKALGAVAPERRTDAIDATMRRAIEFVLIHHVHKRSHDPGKVSKPGWLKFGFPMMYQTDVLEILDILTALGIRDSRMNDAISVVTAKQDEAGRWKLENANDRLLIPVEQKGAESKWITLRAMRVLKRYHG